MSSEVLIAGWLPLFLACALLGSSLYCAVRARTLWQVGASFLVVPSMARSIFALILMLRGAWPILIPHLLIVLAIPVVLAQAYSLSRSQTLKSKPQ